MATMARLQQFWILDVFNWNCSVHSVLITVKTVQVVQICKYCYLLALIFSSAV